MRSLATILVRLLAASAFAGFLMAMHAHLLAFRGGEYSRIVSWHWPLGFGAFVALIMLSLLLGAMGHKAAYGGITYEPVVLARYEYDKGVFRWPTWARGVVVAVSLYSAWAFVAFFLNGADIVDVDGQYLQYLGGSSYDSVSLTFEEYDSFRVENQRGLTAIYLPFYIAVAASAFFVSPPHPD